VTTTESNRRARIKSCRAHAKPHFEHARDEQLRRLARDDGEPAATPARARVVVLVGIAARRNWHAKSAQHQHARAHLRGAGVDVCTAQQHSRQRVTCVFVMCVSAQTYTSAHSFSTANDAHTVQHAVPAVAASTRDARRPASRTPTAQARTRVMPPTMTTTTTTRPTPAVQACWRDDCART
jgi:hypothetical protein